MDEQIRALLMKFEDRRKKNAFGKDWLILAWIYNKCGTGWKNGLLFPDAVEKFFSSKYRNKTLLYSMVRKNIDCLDRLISYHNNLIETYERVKQGTGTRKAKETPTWYLNLTDTIWSIFVSDYEKRRQKKGQGIDKDFALLARNIGFVQKEILNGNPKVYLMVEGQNAPKPDAYKCIKATLCLYAASAYNLRYPDRSLAAQKRKEKEEEQANEIFFLERIKSNH